MSHTLTCLHTHVVFSTKEREPKITPELKPRLLAYMGGIVRELDGKAVIINAMIDHVHMLLRLPPTLSLSDCIRLVKTNASRWAHQQGYKRFAWQTGFSGFSVSTSTLPQVTAYIREQERHHRKVSFQDELRTLLRKHGISFDERYLWD
ncbi:MAG: IS200/IS605 family transposase [Acidobacteriales bacterium]|nr:IS200/IS605 family transposase [Terriglobales bacterium]